MSYSNGPCWTLNPCAGIPVGKACRVHADCRHEEGVAVEGGLCVDATCICTKCQSVAPGGTGTPCRVMKQLMPASFDAASRRAHGFKLTLNTPTETRAAVASDLERGAAAGFGGGGGGPGGVLGRSLGTAGTALLLHAGLDAQDLERAILVPAGRGTEIELERQVHLAKGFPHTNCSLRARATADLCVSNCLRRHMALTCCGVTAPELDRGRPPLLTREEREALKSPLDDDPLLHCDLLGPATSPCLAEVMREFQAGRICVGGALGLRSGTFPYSARVSWYNDAPGPREGADDAGVALQEIESRAVKKNCIYSPHHRALFPQPRHGQPCEAAADCPLSRPQLAIRLDTNQTETSDTKSDTNQSKRSLEDPWGDEEGGACQEAVRAYCPPSCSTTKFHVQRRQEAPLGAHTVAAIASLELGLATALEQQRAGSNASAEPKTRLLLGWAERCQGSDDARLARRACLTEEDARRIVQRTHSIVQVRDSSLPLILNPKPETLNPEP